MTDLRLPCQEGTADDWFIGRDGRQYPDEDLLSRHRISEIKDEVAGDVDPEAPAEQYQDAVDQAIDRAEADAKREALQRRRHAREACRSCPLRTRCLQLAIDGELSHGTWGGYYEEELREVRREISRRKRGRELRLLQD